MNEVNNHFYFLGVRFEFVNNNLKFGINVRKFDFKTGILSNDSYYIYGSGNR